MVDAIATRWCAAKNESCSQPEDGVDASIDTRMSNAAVWMLRALDVAAADLDAPTMSAYLARVLERGGVDVRKGLFRGAADYAAWVWEVRHAVDSHAVRELQLLLCLLGCLRWRRAATSGQIDLACR